MKKILILIVGMSFIISSCSENNSISENEYGMFRFGMSRSEVDSIASENGLECTNRMNERMAFKGDVNILNKKWNWIGLEFLNDSLCKVEYQDWYLGEKVRTAVEDLGKVAMSDFILSHKKSYGYPFVRTAVYDNKDCIVKIESINGTMSLIILPYSETKEDKLIKDTDLMEIERMLKDLTEDVASYQKETNPTIRKTYEDDIRREIKFLDDNLINMTSRQKEYYLEIKNL